MRRSVFIVTMLLFFAAGRPIAAAEEAATRDPNQLFYTANHFYETGDYKKAVEMYLAVLDLGVENGRLHYNIGNGFFKLGEIGYAILCYERARRLIPQDSDLKSNLEYAKELAGVSSFDTSQGRRLSEYVKAPFSGMNLNFLAILTAMVYLALLIAIAIGALNPIAGKKIGIVSAVLLAMFIFTLTSFSVRYYDEEILKYGVIIQKNVECKYEPIDKATTYYKPQEGDEVLVLKTREGWRQIKRGDGKMGWVKAGDVDAI